MHALAYNLANFMRTLALPEAVAQWSLTSLREKLIKIGAKVVRHARYAVFQMAEVAAPRELFEQILRLIDGQMRRHHGRSASAWRGKGPNGWIRRRFGRLTRWERRENCVGRPWLHRNPAE